LNGPPHCLLVGLPHRTKTLIDGVEVSVQAPQDCDTSEIELTQSQPYPLQLPDGVTIPVGTNNGNAGTATADDAGWVGRWVARTWSVEK
jgi:hypothetical protein